MDAFLEFLTENRQRRYPFAEDAALTETGGEPLPDDVVLDLRGFHRERPEADPQLIGAIGPDGAAISSLGALPGFFSFYFAMGRGDAPLIFRMRVPASNTEWPYVDQREIADENYPGQTVYSGKLQVTFGDGVSRLPSDISWYFDGTAPIEPALVSELYRNQLDYLKLIHRQAESDFVSGDVVLKGGYNLDVLQLRDSLRITAAPGAGTLGRFTGSTLPPEASACRGRVVSLNRIQADSRGRFYIKGENGILVRDLPAEHKIQILLTPEALGGNRCG